MAQEVIAVDVHAEDVELGATGGCDPLDEQEDDEDNEDDEDDEDDDLEDAEEDKEQKDDPDFDKMIASGHIWMKVCASG